LEGEFLLGGYWNMTSGQRDQKLGQYNVNKNRPLTEMVKALDSKDVWRRLHRGEETMFTWRKGAPGSQEKRLDGFLTKLVHTCPVTHSPFEIDSDHRPVETIREWDPLVIKEKNLP